MSDPGKESASVDDQLRERFSKRPIRKMGIGRKSSPGGTISTGVACIDEALGDGLGCGEIVEIYGNDPEAEAMLVCHLLAAAQRRGGVCAYLDLVGTFPHAHAKALGVGFDELLGSGRLCGEDAFAVATTLADSGAIDVLVIDSIPALTPRVELEERIGSGDPGLFAEVVSRGMRELSCVMDGSSMVCLLINRVGNQWDEKTHGWSTVRPAAHTLDRYVSHRLELRRLTKQADRIADPTNWHTRLRIIGRDRGESVQELDLGIEYEAGISSVASH